MLVLCVLILLSLEDDPAIISEAYGIKPAPGELLYLSMPLCVLFSNTRRVGTVTSELLHRSHQSLSSGLHPFGCLSQCTFECLELR